jgi:hypothetical protein
MEQLVVETVKNIYIIGRDINTNNDITKLDPI